MPTVLRPSALGAAELAAWRQMQLGSASLRRAFLSPTFAQACERANGRTYVAVLHQAGGIRGFFPFQFRTAWHERLRLAERIGGDLCDAAGVIACDALRLSSASLMRLCGLGSLVITHLIEDQMRFGLDAELWNVGHLIEIGRMPNAYFAAMTARNRNFVRDTERRLRRAEKAFGALNLVRLEQIPAPTIAGLIELKRQQYQRTHMPDAFAAERNVRLLAAMNEAPAPDCRLVMNRLEAGGRALAQHLGPQHHDVLSYWFPVYDPEAGDVSPGRLLLWLTIQRADEYGIALIDRGEGDAAHKRELATGSTRYGRATWSGRVARSIPARAWQSLEWRLQTWSRRAQKSAA